MASIAYSIGLLQLVKDYFRFHNKNLTKKQNEMLEHLSDAIEMLERTQRELAKECNNMI